MPSTGRRVLAASIAATLLTTAAPAQADPVPWAMAPCVTMSSMEPASKHYSTYIVLEGFAVQCDPVVENGGFRLATYSSAAPTGDAPGYNVRLFPSATVGAVRHFGATAVPATVGEYGVCVLAGQLERVACYWVRVASTTAGDLNVVAVPLATDASLVDKDVVTTPYTGTILPPPPKSPPKTNPACGTCF